METGMDSGAADAAFRVDQRVDGAATIVTVDGELDVHTAPRLASALTDASAAGRPLVVDCSRVPFMDSTGLSVFVAARNQSEASGTGFAVVVTEPAVRKVFAITGLDSVIAIHESLEAALDQA